MDSPETRMSPDIFQYDNANRLLDILFQPHSPLENTNIVVDRFEGYEALSEEFEYKIDLLSDTAYWKLGDVVGLAVGLQIRQADGQKRPICGFVSTSESLGSDGGHAKYRITVVPFPTLLSETLQTRDFADKTSVEIAHTVFERHTQRNGQARSYFWVVDKTTKKYPMRSLCRQYWESDRAFFRRITREDGISYRYTHSVEDEVPIHTLEFFDKGLDLPQCSQPTIRFHRDDGTEEAGTATQFFAKRSIRAAIHSLLTTEYKSVTRPSATQESQIEHGNGLTSTLERYHPVGAYYASSPAELEEYTRLRQQAQDLKTKLFTTTTTVPNLTVGTWFEMSGQPELDGSHYQEDRQFIVLELRLKGRNNLGHIDSSDAAKALGQEKESVYQNEAVIVRRHIPIVPEYTQEFAKPRARGPLTARVVGPEGAVIHTDEMGRILVQLDCMRPADHPDGNANWDDKSSYWVRWVSRGAGRGFGEQNVPWVGWEVLLEFIDGDVDRMIATAVVHNGVQTNTRFTDTGGLPTEKTLVGLKSAAHDLNGYNQHVLDNTPNELSYQAYSTHQQSLLQLGWLGTPRSDGKSAPEGEGFRLQTEAAGVLRAAQSLLLTTEQQKRGRNPQLMREGITQVLSAVLDLTNRLNGLAAQVDANASESGQGNQLVDGDHQPGPAATEGHQTHLKEAVQNLERGFNNDRDSKTGQGDQRGQQPILMISSPAGTAVTSQQNVTVAAGTNVDVASSRDVALTAGRRIIANAVESISLLVDGAKAKIKNVFKVIVNRGDMRIAVLSGNLTLDVAHDIYINAGGKIHLKGVAGIVQEGEGGTVTIGNDILLQNPGTQTQKAGSFQHAGPGNGSPAVNLVPAELKPCSQKNKEAAAKGAGTTVML